MGEFVDDNFIFTIVMDCNFHGSFEEGIESIINQSLNFEDNAQIIFIDSGSNLNHMKTALKYQKIYPDNILTLFDNDCDLEIKNKRSYFYNLAIEHADSTFINFMNEGRFSRDLLEKINVFAFNKQSPDYDFISVPIKILENETKEHILNYKFEDNIILNPLEDKRYIQTRINNVFIKKESIGDLEFDFNLCYFSDSLFINKLLILKNKYAVINDSHLYLSNELDFINKQGLVDFMKFTNQLISCSNENLGYLPEYIQYLFVYYLKDLIKTPVDDIFTREEQYDFWNYIHNLFEFIDLDVILEFNPLNMYARSFLVFIKNDMEYEIKINKKGYPALKSGNFVIDKIKTHKIWLDIVDIRNGFLNISGSFTSAFNKETISITAIKKNNEINETFTATEVKYDKVPSRKTIKYFSIPWKFVYSFDFKIPLKSNELVSIDLQLHYNENNNTSHFNREIRFRRHADLSIFSHYAIKDSRIILFLDNKIIIQSFSYLRILKHELLDLKKMFSEKEHSFDSILHRFLNIIAYPFVKSRKIWLFMDRQDISGDNGEHLFNYAINQNDDIKKYFVIKKDSEDFPRLKKEYGNNLLAFGSFKHKYIYLISEKIISSHPDDFILNPFPQANRKFLAGFLNIQKYFLQHGVGKYDMSRWLRKYDKNLYLLLTVSDLDHDAFAGEAYNFDEDIIQSLGFPRYDNLTNENLKKQIVIIPTWRNFLETEEDFINSEYAHRWNSLLNNQRLINHAKEKGYDIVFKPHPRSIEFLDLFDTHNVKLDNVKGYHQILCDSSLMITDYSSVAFDFAYLKKPVVYYQYGGDYHFDPESAIATDEVDFGEIIDNEDALVDKIISYLDNDCKMEKEYLEKVNKFFKYNDKNNSKRVYEWIKNN